MTITKDFSELIDIRDVRVDSSLATRERISEYRKQIKDPCRFKCGAIKVNAKFADNGTSIEDCLRSMITS